MAKPTIRFKGYTEDWEQRKLGDIADVTKLAGFEFTEHVVYSDKGNVIALRGLNIKNGQLILDDVKYIDGSNFSKLSRSKLFIDDIMFTYVGTVGEVAIIKENDRFYLAPNVSRIRVKSDDSPKFISHYMRTDNFKNKIIFPLIATSSQPALSMENIRKFTINIPINKEEQDCLVKYFDSLDHLITLHQRKCEETKILKKYMLQKMFPQNGQKVPEIRFKGFTEDWEQRKLGDISSLITKGTTPKDKSGIGEVNFIKVENINDFSGDIVGMSKISIEEHQGYLKRSQLQEGDILFSIAGTLGRVTSVNKAILPANTNQALSIIRLKEGNLEYVKTCLKGNVVADFIRRNPTIGAQPNLSLEQVSNLEIMMPSESEQEKIGLCFSNLDHLITLHQRKCEELKNIKKFMLQNMFV